MTKFILLFTILLSLQAKADGEVTTKAENEAHVVYFDEEHHPTKMDWGNWTMCWGANSKSRNHEEKTAHGTSAKNDDSISSVAYVDGPLGQMLASQLDWQSSFDKEDFTFQVHIKRKIADRVDRSNNSTCTTHDWSYKVDSATSLVQTSVKLRVPPNAYVLRIKTVRNATPYQAHVSRVRALPNDTDRKPVADESLSLAGYQYFFTQPGEDFELSLNVDSTNDVRDIELLASYEITFIGQNRCDQTLGALFGSATALEKNPAELLQKYLESMKTSTNLDDLNQSVIGIGCLMNKSVAGGILYRQNAEQIRDVVQVIETFQQSTVDRSLGQEQYASVASSLHVVARMAMASLMSGQLKALEPFCKQLPLFNKQTGAAIGFERGFVKMVRVTKQARVLIGKGFSPYYEDLLRRYQDVFARQQSYADLMADPARLERAADFADLFEANNKVLIAQRVTGLLAGLPPLAPTETSVNLAQSMEQIREITGRIHDRFAREIEKMIARSKERPDLRGLATEIVALRGQENIFAVASADFLKSVDASADEGATERFKTAIGDIATQFTAVAFNLSSLYQGYLKDFVEAIRPDESQPASNQTNYIDEVNACAIGYSSAK